MFDYGTCALLQVSTVNFTATPNNIGVQLKWSTSSETNSKYFLIERSLDERTWAAIRSITAAGNSNTIRNYSFIDIMPLKGINYYRLKQVDADGKYSISATPISLGKQLLEIECLSQSYNFRIALYKNQFKDNGNKITDITGKTILKRFNTISTDIDHINVSSFVRGTYFIEVITNKNEVYYTRFIKE